MSRDGFRGLEQYPKTYNKKADEQLHHVTEVAFDELVSRAPVDTGRFRGNWKGAVSSPNKDTDTKLVQQGVTQGTPTTALEKANLAPALTAKIGQDVWITNNLDYAQRLENGYSPQAPAGTLHVTVANIQGRINRGKI